jgi:hypothetical protein
MSAFWQWKRNIKKKPPFLVAIATFIIILAMEAQY